jgi:hypothetical protein
MQRRLLVFSCLLIGSLACGSQRQLQQYGRHYRQNADFASLNRVVDRLPLGADTAYLKSLLGEPIDMGFDYRYLVDSTGPNGCVIGAVFHLDETGRVDQQWVGEICE